jgi:ComF family protein
MTPFATICGECRLDPPPFGVCRSPGLYEGGLKQCIHLFKYDGRRELARPFGLLMAECVSREFREVGFDALVPVPLHRSKLHARGFNQAELLARELGRRMGVPVANRALVRLEARDPQSTLTRAARLENIRGLFAVSDRERVAGRRFLLIDDVFTTGATVDECVRVLLKNGAVAVDVCTLAITTAKS